MLDVAGFIVQTMRGFNRGNPNFHEILKFHPNEIASLYQIALTIRDLVNSWEELSIGDQHEKRFIVACADGGAAHSSNTTEPVVRDTGLRLP